MACRPILGGLLSGTGVDGRMQFPACSFSVYIYFEFFVLNRSFSYYSVYKRRLLCGCPLILLCYVRGCVFMFRVIKFVRFVGRTNISPRGDVSVGGSGVAVGPLHSGSMSVFDG